MDLTETQPSSRIRNDRDDLTLLISSSWTTVVPGHYHGNETAALQETIDSAGDTEFRYERRF